MRPIFGEGFFQKSLRKMYPILVILSMFAICFHQDVCAQEDQEQAAEIERLQQLGEDHFKNWRYTSPTGAEKNAFDVFTKLLKLDPDNKAALKRMADMEAYYVRKAKAAQAAGDEAKEKDYYQKILIVNPDNSVAQEKLGIKPEPEVAVVEKKPEPTPGPKLNREQELQMERYKTYSESIVKLLNEAHEFYTQRDSENQTPIRQAINTFEEVLKIEPNNYDALWQISRCILWFGDHSPEEQQVEIFARGMDNAKKAIAANPNATEGHYYHGSCMGKYGSARGIFKSLEFIDPIIEEMNTVLKIDPKHAKALTVLGILYRKAPPWPVSVGDIEKSEEFLRRSLLVNPDSVYAHLNLGITFNKQKKWNLAKNEFQKVIDMPFEEDWVPNNKEDKAEAKEILMMLKRRGL
ncbi:tetratricopeptide repeat protein [candidate division CSSED10-310 bacterium]|uniref:Tetratricopeptide repeat protein n=1 Tax=candidate division CSSED10-310 bacterium TaxID=2855610 RepID=A0ABV6YR34_UNCC1